MAQNKLQIHSTSRFKSHSIHEDYALQTLTVSEDYVLHKLGGVSKWSALQSSLIRASTRPQSTYTFFSDKPLDYFDFKQRYPILTEKKLCLAQLLTITFPSEISTQLLDDLICDVDLMRSV